LWGNDSESVAVGLIRPERKRGGTRLKGGKIIRIGGKKKETES